MIYKVIVLEVRINRRNEVARRNLQPYWLKRSLDVFNSFYVEHFCLPHFDSTGKGIRVMNPRYLEVSGPKITLGNDVHIMALRDKPVRLAVYEGLGEIKIGDYCLINPGVRMSSADSITIGDSCMFAMNAYLSDADWHDLQHRIFAPGKHAGITLGNNVWIGDSALICKGVNIGENSIVGAWSVVTKDVPDNVVVAGNPAKVIRALDASDITSREHLFNMNMPYEEFEDDWFHKLLKGNTFRTWFRSLLIPSRRD
ncbi:MAG: acetyltransferase-like isoleucine patch superfamily enzyme [Candidatus Azotimanducaceae bacterium]|jgi:acetyltransferase-like isoleucine patch superfamily enzyme